MIKERLLVCFVLVMLLLVLVLPSDVFIGEPVYSVTPYSVSETEATTLSKFDMYCYRSIQRVAGSGPAPCPTIEAAANLAWDRYCNDPQYNTATPGLFIAGGWADMRYNVTGYGGYFAGIAFERAVSGYDTSTCIPEGYNVTRAYLALSQWYYTTTPGPVVVEASNNPPPYTGPELFAYSGNFAGENTTAKLGVTYIELNPTLINTKGPTYFLFKSPNDGEDIIPRYIGTVGCQNQWQKLALYLDVHPFCIDGSFQPVQVVWQDDILYGNDMTHNRFGDWTAGVPMVQGKNTSLFGSSHLDTDTIRFTVTNNYGTEKKFTLRFRVMPDNKVIYESAVFTAPPGQTPITISGHPPIPTRFQFKNAGLATIEVEVVPAAGSEPIDSNKVVVHVTVKHTKSLSILYMGIRFPWESRRPTVNMKRATDFILGTYPIAESDITNRTYPITEVIIMLPQIVPGVEELHNKGLLNKAPWNETVLAAILKYYAKVSWLGRCWDRVVLVFPDDWQKNFGSDSWTGLSIPSATKGAVLVLQDCLTTVAHEIGHTYNLPVQQRSLGEEYNIELDITGSFAHGYWVNENVEKRPSTSLYCFMSARTHPRQSLEERWVCKPDYEYLIGDLSLTADPEVLGVSGLIFRNNSVVFDQCYRIPEATPDLEAGETGNYYVVLLDNTGTVLSRIGFNATFMIEMGETMPMSETDVVPFAFKIPWMPDTSQIEIRDATDNVLATRIVSGNSPSVTVTFPNGGEILMPPQNYTITWESLDPDGDPLSYAVLYSNDDGTSWLPLAIDYKETSYVWNVTSLPLGSNYLVKIIATDGVNTGEDVSDDTFAIVGHDVAISNVAPSKSVVGQGYSLNINVTAANQGDYTENFNVTVYANTTSIASQNVILTSGNSTTITLTWNTTGFALGNYTISAYATPVSGETDLDDNTFPDGTVKVTIPGDINGDGTVDGMDLGELGMSWLVSEGDPSYVANRDINGDGWVDGMDLGIMGMHWLES